MNLRIMSVLAVCALVGCGGSSATPTSETTSTTAVSNAAYAEVSMDEVQSAISANSAVVVDVNARARYEQHHLPGALWLGEFDATATVPAGEHRPFAFTASQLPTDRAARLVFYGRNRTCWRGPDAATRAVGMGYTNVAVMSDGITGWVAAGKPVEGSGTPPTSTGTGAPGEVQD